MHHPSAWLWQPWSSLIIWADEIDPRAMFHLQTQENWESHDENGSCVYFSHFLDLREEALSSNDAIVFPLGADAQGKGERARSGCFWRGLITKSWKLIGCFLWLNAWRQIVTNVCDAVDRWRDACWHTENDKGLSNGYPHSVPLSCPVTKQ